MIELNLDINRLTAKRNALISEVQELEKQRDSIYNDISDQRYSKTIVQSEKDGLEHLGFLLNEQLRIIRETSIKNSNDFIETYEKYSNTLNSLTSEIDEARKVLQKYEVSSKEVEALEQRKARISQDIVAKTNELSKINDEISIQKKSLDETLNSNEKILKKIEEERDIQIKEKETLRQWQHRLETMEKRLEKAKKELTK